MKQKIDKICITCKKHFYVIPSLNYRKNCSKLCSNKYRSLYIKTFLGHHHTKKSKLSIRNKKKGKSSWNKGIKLPNRCGKNHHWFGRDCSDENNPYYKGDKVGYRGLHIWVESKLGKPNFCEYCRNGKLNHRQYHWANINHKYQRKLADWIRLCAKCHRAFDTGKIVI